MRPVFFFYRQEIILFIYTRHLGVSTRIKKQKVNKDIVVGKQFF